MSEKSLASGVSGSTVKTHKTETSVISITSSKSSNKSKNLSEIAKKFSCHVNLERVKVSQSDTAMKTDSNQETVPTNEGGHSGQNKDNSKLNDKGRIPPLQGDRLYQFEEDLVKDKPEQFILNQMLRHLTRKERGSTDQAKLYRECLEEGIRNLQNTDEKQKKDQENLRKEVSRLFEEQQDKLQELQKQLKGNDKTKMKAIIEESKELKNTVEVIIKTNQ